MKKSILSFGVIMMLFLLVLSCTEEQENIELNNQEVNLKGKVNKGRQEANERSTYNVAHLLTYLHRYIASEVSEDYRYYENMPERKEAKWFAENFERHLKSGSKADEWALDKIDSGEIFVIGITVKDVKVAALIFSEGLELPERFNGKSGIFFDSDTPDDCFDWSEFGQQWGKNCFCHMIYSCHWDMCWYCHDDDENIDIKNLFDLDQWVISDYDLEKFGGVPVSKLSIGNPVLEVERK